jgi:hypothetical protein
VPSLRPWQQHPHTPSTQTWCNEFSAIQKAATDEKIANSSLWYIVFKCMSPG